MRKLISGLILGVLLLVGFTGPANAWYTSSGESNNIAGKPLTWRQNTPEYAGIPLGTSSNLTMASAGCAQFAMAAGFVKLGIKDIATYLPKDFNREGKATGAISSGGGMRWGSVPGMVKGRLKYINDRLGVPASNSVQSTDAAYNGWVTPEKIKEFYNSGYLIFLDVKGTSPTLGPKYKGHFVLVDSVDAQGNIFLIDSAANMPPERATFAELYDNKAGGIRVYEIYDAAGKVAKIQDFPSLNGDLTGVTIPSSPVKLTAEEEEEQWKINLELKDQWGAGEFSINEEVLSLTTPEQQAVKDMMEAHKQESASNLTNTLRIGVSALGYLIILMVFLMGVALLFDKLNTLVHFEMMPLVTFGRFKLLPADMEKDTIPEGSNIKTLSKIIQSMLLLLAIGVILVSGLAYSWGVQLIQWIANTF